MKKSPPTKYQKSIIPPYISKQKNTIPDFEWDKGNIRKNLIGHKITNEESCEAYYDSLSLVKIDAAHIKDEIRYNLIGRTVKGKFLYLVYTIRDEKVRIISARIADNNEKNSYIEAITLQKRGFWKLQSRLRNIRKEKLKRRRKVRNRKKELEKVENKIKQIMVKFFTY